jgi:hypothetical protein
LISAVPQLYDEVIKLVERLDVPQPQVVIQVLVAEVNLNNSEEFGMEVGLQSPILFQRGIIPATAFQSGSTLTYTSPSGTGAPASTLVPPGVTVNTSNPTALNGFNFNNTNPLGNNPLTAGPGIVGFQGLNNLGVGRVSPSAGVGGFVFSAASDAFNILIRALATQGRVDILSRPQLMTLNNQTAYLNIGQEIPLVEGSSATLGVVTQNIVRRQVGVLLQVTPTISPDGTILMRVVPEVSAAEPLQISLGNGQLGTVLDIRHLETTILAHDGETVAIGGMISKRDTKSENKIPCLGDLPLIGAAFRFRTQAREKTEVLIILTPHVVRCGADADLILAEESRRMDWVLADVARVHGSTGLDPIFGPPPELGIFDHSSPAATKPPAPAPAKNSKTIPTPPAPSPSKSPNGMTPSGGNLPPVSGVNSSAVPRALPNSWSSRQEPTPEPVPGAGTFASGVSGDSSANGGVNTSGFATTASAAPPSAGINSPGPVVNDMSAADSQPANPKKESWKWNFFRKQ